MNGSELALHSYRKLYEDELSRKTSISTKISILVGILSVVGGSLTFVIYDASLRRILSHQHATLLIVIGSLCLLAFVVSISLLFKAMAGYEYAYISNPVEISKYIREQESRYSDLNGEEANVRLDTDLIELLTDQYEECVDINVLNNDRREALILWTNRAIAVCLILLSLTFGLFIYERSNYEGIQKVEIVN